MADVILRAAKRWGVTEGRSADDVLVEAFGDGTPEYWAAVVELVNRFRGRCRACGDVLPHGNSRVFCDSSICQASHVWHPSGDAKSCEHCGEEFRRKVNHTTDRWAKRKYCSPDCSNEARYGHRGAA